MTVSETTGRLSVPVWLRNPWGAATLAAAVYAVGYAAWVFLIPQAVNSPLSDAAFLPASLFAALAALSVTFDSEFDMRLRRIWLSLSLALLGQFIGNAVYFFLSAILKFDTGSTLYYAADLFYLLFYPMALWGLFHLAGRGSPLTDSNRWKFLLDLCVVMTAAWMMVWYFIIGPTAFSGKADSLSRLLATAYPVLDLAVFGGLAALLLRSPQMDQATHSTLLLFQAGLLCFIITDLIAASAGLSATDLGGQTLSAMWMASYPLFALAAVRQTHLTDGPILSRSGSVWLLEQSSVALPFVAILAGYGLALLAAQITFTPATQGVLISAFLLTVFVIMRQYVLYRENKRLRLGLEEKVAARTNELQQAQGALFAAQRLASVGVLADSVVNELSNPLTTLLTALDTLNTEVMEKKQPDTDTLNVCLPLMDEAASQAMRSLQVLRSYSRPSAPELALQSLNDTLEDALLLLNYQLKSWTKMKLVKELAPDLPVVLCDHGQIAQVILNLLTNAHDAMPDGGTVTLRTRRTLAGITLEVNDTGVGLPAEALSRILDPFYTTKDYQSGLGLSIVADIVRAHRGAVEVHSEGPERGTTITVTLPAP